MTINAHDIGDAVRVSVNFQVGGSDTDPTALTLTVTNPNGAETTYTYGGSPVVITKDSVGDYHADLSPTIVGRWTYEWKGTGAAVGSEAGVFYIRQRPAFSSVAEVAAFLQVAIDGDNDSANRAIREATAIIQNYCHQTIAYLEDDEHTFDVGQRVTKLFLPELPVLEITEVDEDGETLVVTDDYKLGAHGVLHRIGAYWKPGIQIVTVTYSHGYGTIPEDVVSVCTRSAGRAYQSGLRAAALAGVPGVQATSLGDYSVQYGTEAAAGGGFGASAAPFLLPSEKAILDRYRLKGV